MNHRRKHLEFLRRTAIEAHWAGDYERALTLWEDGLGLARAWKDRDLEDTFTCNRATTLLDMDRFEFDLAGIKEIVLRSPDKPNGVLAAYVAANVHEAKGEFPKALFYAQSSLQKSRDLGLDDLEAGSLNLLANLELRTGQFEEARDLFARSLARFESRGQSSSRESAVTADNLGYCHIALDDLDAGLPLVRRSLMQLELLGARQAMDYPSLDLCFAHIKMNRTVEAEFWGKKALGLGEEFGREDVIKNAHYLLAEACGDLGRDDEADVHYDALAKYYPDFPALKNYLRQISLVEMINLRA